MEEQKAKICLVKFVQIVKLGTLVSSTETVQSSIL